MEDQKKTANNVIQFPGRKKEEEKAPSAVAVSSKKTATKKSKKTIAGSVLAVALLTAAVNRYTFEVQPSSMDLASSQVGRQIASVDRAGFNRDAQWEKQLAEKLASPELREVAAVGIGRAATKEEKLRWGILEEKYTITYSPEDRRIHTILLQDPVALPAYILDRTQFLNEYGSLFEGTFATSKLKSVEKSEDKTVESYTLYGTDNQPKGEARFELDRHKRLLSLKVEPVQI